MIGTWLAIDFQVDANLAPSDAMSRIASWAFEKKLLGWIRKDEGELSGRIIYPALWRNRRTATATLSSHLGAHAKTSEPVAIEGSDYVQLANQFILIPDQPRSTWVKRNIVAIDRSDHRGWISGWVNIPEHRNDKLRAEIYVDGTLVSTVTPNSFRYDLLMRGFKSGEVGFSGPSSEKFCDGAIHQVDIVVTDSSSLEIAHGTKNVQFPKVFSVSRPWRGSSNLDDAGRLKLLIAEHGPEAYARDVSMLWDRDPHSIFRDFSLSEHAARNKRTYLNFREMLISRLLDRNTNQLIRDLSKKDFTKDYCAARNIKHSRTLLITSDVDVLRSFQFPNRFVLKPASGSGEYTYLFHDGVDLFTRSKITIGEILNYIDGFCKKNPGIPILVEELFGQRGAVDPAIPLDYKFHVFGGKARIVHIDDRNVFTSRDRLYRQQGWFSMDWKPAPFRMRRKEEEVVDFELPTTFLEMRDLAERIGKECGDYVRVDIYDTDEGVALGEVTPFSHSGEGFTDFGDLILSQAWQVSRLVSAGCPESAGLSHDLGNANCIASR